jgi:hypothetical protein
LNEKTDKPHIIAEYLVLPAAKYIVAATLPTSGCLCFVEQKWQKAYNVKERLVTSSRQSKYSEEKPDLSFG